MQTILGSGGTIGRDLAKELTQYTSEIRLVSRNPIKINETDTLFSADITNAAEVNKAVEGSEICYLTIGLEYDIKVWQEKWPLLVKNVVEACIRHKSRLVFFDNVYAIGGDNVKHITEQSPISPSSKKGEVRAAVDTYILEEIEKGRLDAIIARSPDFFGPSKKENSVLMIMIYDYLMKGKTAKWFCNSNVIHSMGYGPELAKGTALLGNTPEAYNQIWNLPVDNTALTGREWVKLFSDELKTSYKVQVYPSWMIKMTGLFVPVFNELHEMLYQYDRPYYFDSSKFVKRFNYSPVRNIDAVKETIEKLKQG